MITPGGSVAIPGSVAHLDPDVVTETLSRHGVNVTDAARELGVASADLRRLLWAKPHLANAAVEMEERRLDLAERNIYEALTSDDSRRRDAASMFTIRNSHRSRRRGWVTSSSSAAELSVSAGDNGQRRVTFRWIGEREDVSAAEAEEDERWRDEGVDVIKVRWGKPDGGKVIEHEARPESSTKD